MGGCWQSLGLRAAWCVMLIVAVLPPRRWCRGMPLCLLAVPSERVRIRAGALRALGPLSITCEGFRQITVCRFKALSVMSSGAAEFVTKLPWEAEEHVGQREAGRGSRRGRRAGPAAAAPQGPRLVHGDLTTRSSVPTQV